MHDHRFRLTLILGALTAFAPMSIDLYLPALPEMQRTLSADAAAVQWTLAAFFVGFAAGQMFYGPITDRYGRKRPLYFGLVVYVLASVGCAFAPSVHALVWLRLAQAIGACAAAVIARAMVRDLFEPKDAARVFSTLMLVMGVAPILAPLLGGYILVWFGWQAIFHALALFGLACLVASVFGLRETHGGNPAHSLHLGRVLGEYRRIFAVPAFHRNVMGASLSMGGLFAYITASPFVFIEYFAVPAQVYGWIFGANALGLILASQINRVLLRQTSGRRLVLAASLMQTVAGALLVTLAWTGAGGMPALLAPLFVFIACLGIILPNASAAALAPFAHNAGSASALMGTLQFGMAGVISAVVGALHARSAMPMAAVMAASGLAALAIVPRRPLRPH